jgi:hypothetical protein
MGVLLQPMMKALTDAWIRVIIETQIMIAAHHNLTTESI